MKTTAAHIFIATCLIMLCATSAYCQSSAMEKKMGAILSKSVPGAKVNINKTTQLAEINESSGGSAYNFKVPYLQANYKYDFICPNLRDTTYRVNVDCASGQSCITLTQNGKEHHTRSIILSMAGKKDAAALTKLFKQLKTQKK